jgi:hypothetical protein
MNETGKRVPSLRAEPPSAPAPASELTEKRLDVIIESEFQMCVEDAPELINAEQVARHGAERLKRELMRLGFAGTPELREPAE